MTTGLLFALASALVLGFVLLPLTRRRPVASTAPLSWSTNGRFRGLEEQRANAMEALRDLEFEFQLGNLTEEDYHRLRERYSRRAVALLQAVETADQQLDEEIEEAVRRLRQGAARPAARPGSPQPVHACPNCGTLARPQDRFCAACGTSLEAATPAAQPKAGVRPASVKPGGAQPARLRVPLWAAISGTLAFVFVIGVGVIYFQASGNANQQEPFGHAGPLSHVHGLMVSAQAGNTVFLSHHNGLQVSQDGGRTFATVSSVQGDGMGLVSNASAPNTMWLAGHSVLLKSVDGGQSWAPLQHNLPGTDIHALAGHPSQPQTLYAFVVDNGLFRSADGGATWTLLSDQVPDLTTGMTIVPGTPDSIYLSTQDQGVFVSLNDGRAWTNASGFVNGALPTKAVSSITYDPKSGDHFESGGGATFNGALYVGTDRGVFKSTDGGQSWNALSLKSGVAAIAVDPADGRTIFAADSGGAIFKSTDRGVTWRNR